MLFQPTSITPDHLGSLGNGIVDPSMPLVVSWMVNGNSAMTAYKIDYYYNDANNTLFRTTGKLTAGCPFYGTDALGNKQFFSYEDTAMVDWTSYDPSVTEWKLVITQWWSADDYVVQSSPSAFTTKAQAALILTPPGTIDKREYTFTATYSGGGTDALNWVRWQIAVNTLEGRENPLYDSGYIYGTALLECYYDGFFTGESYCVRCMAETQNGIDLQTEWNGFLVLYDVHTLVGTVSATKADGGKTGVYLKWDGFQYINGHGSGQYSVSNAGILNMQYGSSVYWNEVNGSPMEIETPWNVVYKTTVSFMSGDNTLFEINMGIHQLSITYNAVSMLMKVYYDSTLLYTVSSVRYSDTVTMLFTPTDLYIRHDTFLGGLYPANNLYPANTLYPSADNTPTIYSYSQAVTYTQEAITSFYLYGIQACDYVQEISGTLDSDMINTLVPTSGNPYAAVPSDGTNFFADFSNELNAGTLYIAGTEINGWAVYRRTEGDKVMMHIADTEMFVSAIYDYSVRSGKGPYTYYVYPKGTDKYITSPLISNSLCVTFWNWAILECSLNNDGSYEVENEFLFGKNLTSGAMTNNNAPGIFKNFTQYPTVQLAPQNYRSGSLTSYIGTISNGEYADTLEQRNAIEKLSTTTNSLFLKNRKGDLMEIRLSEPVSFSTMDNSAKQALSVTLSWVQVYDAEETSIIKTVCEEETSGTDTEGEMTGTE